MARSIKKFNLEKNVKDMLDKKNKSTIKVNGVEVSIEEYIKDPKKYNSIKMPKALIKEIQEHSKKAEEDKKRLYVDPTTLRSII